MRLMTIIRPFAISVVLLSVTPAFAARNVAGSATFDAVGVTEGVSRGLGVGRTGAIGVPIGDVEIFSCLGGITWIGS